MKCLFNMDRNGCGGMISKIYYYSTFVLIALAIIYIIVIAFFFNKINLIISLIKTSLKITNKLDEVKFSPFIGIFFILIYTVGFIY